MFAAYADKGFAKLDFDFTWRSVGPNYDELSWPTYSVIMAGQVVKPLLPWRSALKELLKLNDVSSTNARRRGTEMMWVITAGPHGAVRSSGHSL